MSPTLRSSSVVALSFLLLLFGAQTAFAQTGGQNRVIYHLNLGLDQASDALRNIKNHLSVDRNAKIAVVAHSKGVDFLMEGAADKNGNPYNIPVEELAQKGVEFKVCEITIKSRQLDRNKFLPEVKFVPSGVQEVTRLQAEEGYAYLKP
jgi:hypothetical protein